MPSNGGLPTSDPKEGTLPSSINSHSPGAHFHRPKVGGMARFARVPIDRVFMMIPPVV
jgi:hypothetical protein